MIDSSLTSMSTFVTLPVSLQAGCVLTLHIVISNGALAATTKDPMAYTAKGIYSRMHSLSGLCRNADKQLLCPCSRSLRISSACARLSLLRVACTVHGMKDTWAGQIRPQDHLASFCLSAFTFTLMAPVLPAPHHLAQGKAHGAALDISHPAVLR